MNKPLWKLRDGRTITLLTLAELKGLPDGVVVTCIDGTEAVKGVDDIDDDTRAGLLAYGLPVAASPSLPDTHNG